jgi:hypothetical protein
MVWLRMGLLDEAIREHLELKRRRGADPGEVAREQHEALDPLMHDAAGDRGGDGLSAEPTSPQARQAPESSVITAGVPDEMPDDLAEVAPAGAMDDEEGALRAAPGGAEETAELDMRAVLGEAEQPSAPSVAGGVRPAPAEGESLEWQMPGDDAEDVLESEDAEDVLEETPDFLRDTPEQERLWFEQRPPRDFDFDK